MKFADVSGHYIQFADVSVDDDLDIHVKVRQPDGITVDLILSPAQAKVLGIDLAEAREEVKDRS